MDVAVELSAGGVFTLDPDRVLEVGRVTTGTAGMIMSSVGLLKTNPNPAEPDIRSGLQGTLCRCGTYPRIVRAVRMVAQNNGGRHA